MQSFLSTISIAGALLLSSVQGFAQDSAPKYSLKDAEAKTGSKFKRDVVISPDIPLNLPYEKMSEAQKEILKSPYESMGPDDEPPFPLNGLAAILTEMSEAQKILEVQGKFRLHALIDASGKVESVAVMDSVDKRFDVYVAGVLMRAKFKPARCKGVPCAQEYLFSWNLELVPR